MQAIILIVAEMKDPTEGAKVVDLVRQTWSLQTNLSVTEGQLNQGKAPFPARS